MALNYRLFIFIIISLYVFSLSPSLAIPYILDDVDLFHKLGAALNSHQLPQWIMAPHNEHVISLIKSLYFICYKYFWLDPTPYHLIVISLCAGILFLVYKIIYLFTESLLASMIGVSILAASNLTDNAIFITTDSAIIFCAFLFLLMFYAIYQFALTQKLKWRITAFISCLLLPSTFSLGLTSIIFVFLFEHLCLSKELREKSKGLFPLLLIAWLLSLIPYLQSMNAILYSDHYRDTSRYTNSFQIAIIDGPAKFILIYVFIFVVPLLLPNFYLAFAVFFSSFFSIANYFKEIKWKKVLFFVLLGLLNNFIIFVFRYRWGPETLQEPRFYVFPCIMMAFCYALILNAFFQTTPRSKHTRFVFIACFFCFISVAVGSINRYQHGELAFKNTVTMQRFYNQFRNIFVTYSNEHPGPIIARRQNITLPTFQLFSLNGIGPKPLSRYPTRSLEFYAVYILPEEVYNKITWSNKGTDFLQYFK